MTDDSRHQPGPKTPVGDFSVASARGGVPLLGHAAQLLFKPLDFLASLPDQGDLVKIRMGPWPVHVVCHPELVHRLLASDRCFDKGGPLYDRLRDLIGDGLASCPYAIHRRRRRLVQPAFHHTRLPLYATVMTRQIDETTSSWADGQVLDLRNELTGLATRVLSRTIFTADFSGPAIAALIPYAELITSKLSWRLLWDAALKGVPTPGKRHFTRTTEELRSAVYTMARRYRASDTDHGDLMSMLLSARDDDGSGLTDAEIFAEVVTMVLAGTGTVPNTLSWAFHSLAQHPDIEKRLHSEVDEVLGGRCATWDDLPALPLTGRIFTEAMRHFPSDWLVTRVTTEDTEVAGLRLAAGSVVAYSGQVVHRRPDVYPQPDLFLPDRWLDTGRKPPRGAFLSFGGGARKCIGDKFGTIEGVLALSTIAARWRLEPARPGRSRSTSSSRRSARPPAMRLVARG
ncbi:cytochrome P450 [Streptomyces sp. NPDC097640]|uniref:cytochrome P450 n=1 Tax=Streptomyces sp. NPDC097640 TaxID=3157229 RepID=UPI0033186417